MPEKKYTVHDDISSFYANQKTDSNPFETANRSLHTHNYDEIYIFLQGDATFIIEGVYYSNLKPYDILLIKSGELHCVKHNSGKKMYKRIVLSLTDAFYSKNNCAVFRDVFSGKKSHISSLIPADEVKSSDLFDILIRLEKYIKDSNSYSDIMVNCAIIELLYSINKLGKPKSDYKNDILKQTIDYINEHIGNKISLDDMANHFFVSKCHLCRTFKANTGITINQYITSKRITLTEELFKSGKNITDACLEAGFGSYTNFYKAYIKEKGINPRNGLNTNI